MSLTSILALASVSFAAISIQVDAENGQVVSGEHTFTARVTSDSLVTSVEFYVEGDLRDTDESTPYQFTVDTLAFDEGDLNLTFAAFNEEGESAEQSVTVEVDNGLEQGVDFFIEQGLDQVSVAEFEDAILSGRKALIIEPDNNQARLVMARAYMGLGTLDSAQKFAEDVLVSDPQNLEALNLLSAINIRRAFNAEMSGADREDVVEAIETAVTSAAENRRQVVDAAAEAFGQVTDENVAEYARVMLAADRYGLAIMELEPRFRENPENAELGDLLTYAQIRAGRFFDADATLTQYEQFGTLSGFGHALKAALAAYLNENEVSRAAEREAILEAPGDASTRSAMAYMALIRGDARTMGEMASTLIRDAGQYSETQYLVSAMYYRVSQFDAARQAFQAALLADPLNYDMHVERANQALRSALDTDTDNDEREFQLDIAASYLDAALIARPESFEALTGLAVVRSAQGQHDTAVQLAEAATNAGPDYAAGWYVLSAVLFDAREDGASEAMDRAGELDNRRLRGRGLPQLERAWDYFFRYGRLPIMPAVD